MGAYPLFVLSCLLARWNAGAHEWPAGAWVSLVPTLLFLQTWAPDFECTDTVAWCATQPWNEPAWFVSALFFCWLAFPLAYRATARLGGCGAAAAAAALLAVAIFYDAIWWTLAELSNPGCYEGSGDDTEWCYNYFARRRWLEVYLPRHPLISFVKFALGGCLARLTLAGKAVEGVGIVAARELPKRIPAQPCRPLQHNGPDLQTFPDCWAFRAHESEENLGTAASRVYSQMVAHTDAAAVGGLV